MSQGINYLHSHSAIERDLNLPKRVVLVDEKFGEMFRVTRSFEYKNKVYYKVPVMEFVRKGGAFRNLDE
jgi:hypothetical protein